MTFEAFAFVLFAALFAYIAAAEIAERRTP